MQRHEHRYSDRQPPRAAESDAVSVGIPDEDAPAPAGNRLKNFTPRPGLGWVQLRNAVFSTSIFKKMVGKTSPGLTAGELVMVYDRDGLFFGVGLFNPQSQIALRMLSFTDTEVTESFLEQRLMRAVALRRRILKLDATTNVYRVVHAEGDGLPGLIVDRLGDAAVVEILSMAMFKRIGRIKQILLEVLPVQRIIFRTDEHIQRIEGFFLRPDDIRDGQRSGIVEENGLRFAVDLAAGHKTGFFCDQRDNRLALTSLTSDARMLDVCCYSGGFGIYAAAIGQAAQITAVDLDEAAVALARRNANLNRINAGHYQCIHADGFGYLRQMKQNDQLYDVVVLDPPKLIAARDEFAEGRKKYFDFNRLAMGVVKPGGMLVTCSCSGLLDIMEFQNMLRGAARSARKRVQILRVTGPGADHPVMTEFLEGQYLKCAWCRIVD
ncbi:MAG: class I SAM-dependent rRNA methyltransferase [Phycisphaerae bacterium]